MNRDGSKMSKRDKAKVARKAAAGRRAGRRLVEGVDRTPRPRLPRQGERRRRRRPRPSRRALDLELPEIEVADFRRSGYLPETLCNYLSLLGWSPGRRRGAVRPRLPRRSTSTWSRIGRKNAKFDRDKLFRFDADDLAAMPPAGVRARCWRAHCEAFEPAYVERLDDGRVRQARRRPTSRAAAHSRSPADLARFFILDDDGIVYDDEGRPEVAREGRRRGVRVLARAREPPRRTLDPFTPEADRGAGRRPTRRPRGSAWARSRSRCASR